MKINRADVKPFESSLVRLCLWTIGLLAVMVALLLFSGVVMRKSMKKMAEKIEALEVTQLTIMNKLQAIAP
jgi:type VI protein secretion system component VasK